jgi:hypothetical protein
MSNILDEQLNSSFELFDHIYDRTKNKSSITDSELIELVENFRKLFSKTENIKTIRDYIFVLIRTFSLRFNTDSKVFDIPFQGEKVSINSLDTNTFDIKFDIRNFPIKLQLVLLEYSRLELNKNPN